MKLRNFIACLLLITIIITTSFSALADDIYANRGEVADMLLMAADFYNPEVARGDIIKGYEDGLLHEERNVTRAEALVMLGRAFGNLPQPLGHNKRVSLKAENFSDIPQWAQGELQVVFDSGIVAGTAKGIFSPNDNVTKAQMKLFIERVYALYATNPKDDFYASVNKDTLENLHISSGNFTAGTLEKMQAQTTRQVDGIINEAVSSNNPQGTPKQKMADFYKCIVDTDSRNKIGIKPIKPYLDKIDSIKNIFELIMVNNLISEELCVNSFIKFALTVDIDDSSKYILCFEPMSPIMNKELYLQNDEKKDAYVDYLKTLLTLSGEEDSKAIKNADRYFEFEKLLSASMLSGEEQTDIEKLYTLSSYNKLSVMFPDFDLDKILSNYNLVKDDRILIKDIKLTQKFAQLCNQSNIEVLKTAMKVSLLTSWGNQLNEEFLEAEYNLNKIILGLDGTQNTHQEAVTALKNTMSEYLSSLYLQKYFDEESKKDVEEMTYEIIEVFKGRIDNLPWMSEETKEKAKIKLNSLSVKIGYPDKAQTYLDNVIILSPKKGGTYFSNMLSITKEAIKYYGGMQFSDVNHNMWFMDPYTVNAAYNASANDITLPAAILQPPLYDKNASFEENLGGIGYIIAHEIIHSFDLNGSKFDENGNINNWWHKEDYEAFELLCEDVVAFFDGKEAIPAIQNNGRLTLNENLADMGAAACITELESKQEKKDYKKLYMSMANVWLSTSSREYAAYVAQTDPHSNGKLRINRVLMNLDEFYEAFDIEVNDGMYIPPEDRILVW